MASVEPNPALQALILKAELEKKIKEYHANQGICGSTVSGGINLIIWLVGISLITRSFDLSINTTPHAISTLEHFGHGICLLDDGCSFDQYDRCNYVSDLTDIIGSICQNVTTTFWDVCSNTIDVIAQTCQNLCNRINDTMDEDAGVPYLIGGFATISFGVIHSFFVTIPHKC